MADAKTWYLGDIRLISRKASQHDPSRIRMDLFRHLNGVNILFVDGHVVWYPGVDVMENIHYTPANHRSMENYHLN